MRELRGRTDDCPKPFGHSLLLRLDGIVYSIVFWSGSLETIPDGWQLCDGTNGTRDLRDYLPRHSGLGSMPGTTGGSTKHEHNITGFVFDTALGEGISVDAGDGLDLGIDENDVSINSLSAYNLPPYKSLYPIMFVGS